MKQKKITDEKINFLHANQFTFDVKKEFDLIFSNLVISYAKSLDELNQFFMSAYKHLAKRGKFLSIIVNPEYLFLNKKKFNRIIRKGKNNTVEINFLNNKNQTILTSHARDFKKHDYEIASELAGFRSIKRKKVKPHREKEKNTHADYRNDFNISQPYIMIEAIK